MPEFLFDTDHLTLYEHQFPPLMERLARIADDAVSVCPVTAEEALRGRLGVLARQLTGSRRVAAYENLVATLGMLSDFSMTPYDDASERELQRLKAAQIRVGTQDLKMAAIALANGLTVLTRNTRDFARVPGLMFDDWSK